MGYPAYVKVRDSFRSCKTPVVCPCLVPNSTISLMVFFFRGHQDSYLKDLHRGRIIWYHLSTNSWCLKIICYGDLPAYSPCKGMALQGVLWKMQLCCKIYTEVNFVSWRNTRSMVKIWNFGGHNKSGAQATNSSKSCFGTSSWWCRSHVELKICVTASSDRREYIAGEGRLFPCR